MSKWVANGSKIVVCWLICLVICCREAGKMQKRNKYYYVFQFFCTTWTGLSNMKKVELDCY